ncbi:hypothetical protein AB6869_12405 [Rahnella rivi]|uniref:hypothetical protein n=1 Tax=Rahnella rivi TaxID=2816249 RepID=UPI0006F84EFD|nr:hypothetical protein ASE99_22720 [Serratia sp. Leaf51]
MTTNSDSALLLVDDDNFPVLTARSIPTIDSLPENTLRLDEKGISQFNQMLSLIPQASSTIAAHSKHIVHCNIAFDRLMVRKDGTGSLGMTRNAANGQITEHVSLNPAEKLKSVVNTGLLLNLASTIVAQKHLADINEKLEKIVEVVNKIHAFQQDERSTKIAAFHQMLCQAGTTLAKGDAVSEFKLQTLSNSKQDIHGIALHLKKNIETSVAKLDSFDSTSLFGSNDIRDDLKGIIDEQSRLFKEYIFSMQCLMMANLILYYQDDLRQEFKDEAEWLMKEIAAAGGVQDIWKQSQQKIMFQLSRMRPLFERAVSTEANARHVEIHARKSGDALMSGTALLASLNQRLEPMAVDALLEIENGKVVGGVLVDAGLPDA